MKWFVLALGLGALTPLACSDDGRPELVLPPGKLQDGGAEPDVVPFDGFTSDDGGDWDATDAGLSRVLVGVTPNSKGDGPAVLSDVVAAQASALAVGVRGVVLRRTAADLASEEALGQLGVEASVYGTNGVTISFVFAVVDGMVSGMDESLAGLSWDDPNVANVMHERIDQVFVRLGGYAPIFVIGRDVDEYLLNRPDERAAFEAFVLDLVEYVRTNPLAPPEVRVGVGFSFQGVNMEDPSFPVILDHSDVAVVSYLPGLGSETVSLENGVAGDVDILVERSVGKPIVLESLGYPTSDVVHASDAMQELFLQKFFTALGPRRASFAFVNVDMLHDLGPQRCAERALRAGHTIDSPWATYFCSTGLHAADGKPKPSWQVFIAGAAAFASP